MAVIKGKWLGMVLAGAAFAPAAATPPLPMPPMPPSEATRMLRTPEPRLRSTGDPRVDAYRQKLLTDHTSREWRPYLVRLLANTRAAPTALAEYDRMAQIDTAAEYVRHYVTPARIARGREIYRNIGVGAASAKTMPVELQVALWGMLSDYGASRPQYDALEALLTLGAYGRVGVGAEFPLHQAAAKVLSGTVPRTQMKVFASGKLGQTQSPIERFPDWAVDGNGDGRIDIWNNRSDILATIAGKSWEGYAGVPVAVAVRIPNYDPNSRRDARYLAAIRNGGPNVPPQLLKRWDGRAWQPQELGSGGTLVGPVTPGGPSFLMLRPAWPVNSRDPMKPLYPGEDKEMGFALAASLLADAIAGRPLPPLPR